MMKDDLITFLKKGGFRGGGISSLSQANDLSSTSVSVNVTTATYNATQNMWNVNILCNATTQAITVNLPTAISNYATFNIKKTDSSINTVTIDGNGTETIDGDTTKVIQFQNTSLQLISNGVNWNII